MPELSFTSLTVKTLEEPQQNKGSMPHWTSHKHHFHITRLKQRWCRLCLAFAVLDSDSVLALAGRQSYDKVKPFLPAKNPALYQILDYFWKSPAPGVDNRFLHPYLPSSIYQFFCCRFYYFLPSLFFVVLFCFCFVGGGGIFCFIFS